METTLRFAAGVDGFEFTARPEPFLVPSPDGVFGEYEEYGVEDSRGTLWLSTPGGLGHYVESEDGFRSGGGLAHNSPWLSRVRRSAGRSAASSVRRLMLGWPSRSASLGSNQEASIMR